MEKTQPEALNEELSYNKNWIHTKPEWAIVDSTGKVLETFRLKGTADEFKKRKYDKMYYSNLKVVKI